MKYKLIAKSQTGEGMLPMKQSEELESEKSDKQKSQELCNFIKNAFVADGDVSFVRLEKPIEMRDVFIVEDSKRGNFIIGIRN
jgi:hypothetical protein